MKKKENDIEREGKRRQIVKKMRKKEIVKIKDSEEKRRKTTVWIDKEKMKARGFLKKEKGQTDNEKKEETIKCEASEQVLVTCSILLCSKFDEKKEKKNKYQ